jgi:hypothetical protein
MSPAARARLAVLLRELAAVLEEANPCASPKPRAFLGSHPCPCEQQEARAEEREP